MASELTLLEMAEALNTMERPMDSWECGFHDSVLKRLRASQALSVKQEAKLREIYKKYLDRDEDDEPLEDPGDDVNAEVDL